MEAAKNKTPEQPTPDQAQNETRTELRTATHEETPEPSGAANTPTLADSAAPLDPIAGYLAMVDARQRGASPEAATKVFMAEQLRGRFEVETKRISEEVTRAAQARLQARQPQPKLTTATQGAVSEAATRQASAQAQVITRVIAPLDGSASAERALPTAAALARIAEAVLLLVYVNAPHAPAAVEELASLDDRLEGIGETESAPPIQVFDPLTYLTNVRARLPLPNVEIALLDAESVVVGLAELTQAHGGDVLVVAPHRRSAVRRLAFGSVVDGLIQHGSSAVLIVPARPGEAPATSAPSAEAAQAIAPATSFRRILIPVDGSALAESAIAPLMGLLASAPTATGAADHDTLHEIVLLRVAESYPTLPVAEQYVSNLCADLRALPLPRGITWSAAALVGSPSRAIAAITEHGVQRRDVVSGPGVIGQPFDLVVMATHGRGGFTRWLYGSVAAYVLEHIQTPALLTHPPLNEVGAH